MHLAKLFAAAAFAACAFAALITIDPIGHLAAARIEAAK